MDKLLNFLGLCRRAGKLVTGFDIVCEAVKNKEAKLVIVTCDISRNTEKKLNKTCAEGSVKLIRFNRTKEEFSTAIGRFAAAAAITDIGFAKKTEELITNESGGNCA